jgi:hypothetical protein
LHLCKYLDLPYGWEEQFDPLLGSFFVNHLNQEWTFHDPTLPSRPAYRPATYQERPTTEVKSLWEVWESMLQSVSQDYQQGIDEMYQDGILTIPESFLEMDDVPQFQPANKFSGSKETLRYVLNI